MGSLVKMQIADTPRTMLSLGRKIAQKLRCSSYLVQIRVVEIEISIARGMLQKTVKSA